MLEIKNLTLGYSRHPIVHHLNMSVADGEMLAVIGKLLLIWLACWQ